LENKWNDVYTENFGGMWYPDEGIVKFSARYLKRRIGIEKWKNRKENSKILDAGCGHGRHVVFFAEQGFDVTGIDQSKDAIEVGKKWLDTKNLSAKIEVGDLTNLPYDDNSFDVIVSFGVLDHILFSDAKKAMKELHRVCSPGGYVYLALRSSEDSECGRGEKVADNTFVLKEGYEKGIIQHFFDLYEVKDLFEKFKIFEIDLVEEKFPTEYTVDKGFLQSSSSHKIYHNLDNLDLGLKYCRWSIGAEKS